MNVHRVGMILHSIHYYLRSLCLMLYVINVEWSKRKEEPTNAVLVANWFIIAPNHVNERIGNYISEYVGHRP